MIQCSDDSILRRSAFARWPILALIGILILAGYLRFHKITLQGLWHDELGTMTNVTGRMGEEDTLPRGKLLLNVPILTSMKTARPVTAVVTSLVYDNHPPLYFLTLRAWIDCFGESDYSVRVMSAVFSLLGIVLLFDAARIWHGESAALWACLLMAVAIPQIRYAQEARMYAMSVAFELLAIAALARIEWRGSNARRLAAFALGLAGMLFSNYLTAPVCVAIGMYALVRLGGKDGRRVALAGIGVIVMFLLLCGPLLWAQRRMGQHQGFYWEWDHSPGHVARTLMRAASAPFELMQPARDRAMGFAAMGAILFVLPFLMMRRRSVMLLWGLVLAAPVAFIMALDLWRKTNLLTEIRYLLTASPAVYVLVAALVTEAKSWLRPWLLPVIAITGCVIALPVAYEPYKMDLAPVSAYLDHHIRGSEPVVFAGGSWGSYFTGYLYEGIARYSRAFPRPIAFLDAPAPPKLLNDLRRYPRVWFFCAGPQPMSQYLPGFVDEQNHYFLMVGYLHVGHWGTGKR